MRCKHWPIERERGANRSADPEQTSQLKHPYTEEFEYFGTLPERTQVAILGEDSPIGISLADLIKRQRQVLAEVVRKQRRAIGALERIPPEIWTEIGRMAILDAEDHNSRNAFRLTGVCRRWREIFRADSRMWVAVCLGRKAAIENVGWGWWWCEDKEEQDRQRKEMWGAMVELAGTRAMSVMVILRGEPRRAGPWELLAPYAGKLRRLEAHLLGHESLGTVWDALRHEGGRLRRLTIATPRRADTLDLPAVPLACLTHLTLTGIELWDDTSLHPLLQRTPALKSLCLYKTRHLFLTLPTDETRTVNLPHLRELELGDIAGWDEDETGPGVFLAPNLRSVEISHAMEGREINYADFLFPKGHPANTASLTSLTLCYGLGEATLGGDLVTQLEDMGALESLEVTVVEGGVFLGLRPQDEPRVDEALLGALVDNRKDGKTLLCPRLRHLELGYMPYSLPSGLIEELVGTRVGKLGDNGSRVRTMTFVTDGRTVEPFVDGMEGRMHELGVTVDRGREDGREWFRFEGQT